MDLKSLMRQAQEMQKKMQQVQQELAQKEYEGSSGGGMIRVLINGAGIVGKISIDSSLINVDEKEILEDLLIAAVNDARKKADEGSNDSLRAATSGIPLPPGFKF
ncbi:MAG: nucleoid-associated protein, YbaB/EbfC family [Alphaproteobacteria bacterium RIFCSPLOWO2_01_FULL_40_26]|nr:MAG: nucleoid-associated protein, YbaB/EbfC family [Alphaproteobacteria bacterium RIFCSPHIGHO2_02_FULL_40_34]OFW86351.1 MAG: nucleoid-associated protein, YbaB/EbfC family [Alphaproteobacteria bacterium RIFCSPHIGHO2_01_FULL_40_8]OFW95113.1 MAG: nucleoid-associated protein, YbaB/EbfC family [Alphaproteobacteria bacterium RIFCSPLOWO2_01_FULL_40_26]OFX09064.1 MAG: nucleoid-associated protein, YbaB/EbfC family [Alphaproteobacteria bacterium RIFCSPLOWO2_02_FULL_40_19]OFX10715.1 MAG: nucleoid-assoc